MSVNFISLLTDFNFLNFLCGGEGISCLGNIKQSVACLCNTRQLIKSFVSEVSVNVVSLAYVSQQEEQNEIPINNLWILLKIIF